MAAAAAGSLVAAGSLSSAAAATSAAAADVSELPLAAPPKDGDEALKRLLAGNRRFVRGKLTHPGRDSVRRVEIAEGQKPFAIVLGCAEYQLKTGKVDMVVQ